MSRNPVPIPRLWRKYIASATKVYCERGESILPDLLHYWFPAAKQREKIIDNVLQFYLKTLLLFYKSLNLLTGIIIFIFIMKKTLLFALLTLMLPIVANAYNFSVDGIYYNKNSDGTSVTVTYKTTSYNSYSGSVVIPSTVTYNDTEYSVTSIGSYAFQNCSGLTSVTIPNSVTSIGWNAFYNCSGLTKAEFASIESLCKIKFGNYLSNPLNYAKHLYINGQEVTDVVIPNGVTSIGYYAFYNCTGLTSVTIPNSVTSIGEYTFSGCSGLTSVTIPKSVTSIGYWAFSGCSGLTSITIPESVTSIGGYAFEGCSGLTSITIPNSVTSIGIGAFYNTAWYNNQPDGLIYAGKVAYKYKGTMPDGTEIVIKDGTTEICGSAFSGCSGLTSVTIPNSVTSIGGSAFSGTAWYNNQPDGLVYAGMIAYKYKGTMATGTKITLEEGTLGIGSSAFSGCSGLTSVTIPNSVTSIGQNAFSSCSGLISINLPEGITSIEKETFEKCHNLSSVTIPSSVIIIKEQAFKNCESLTSLTIPNSVTSIGKDAFRYCSGLTTITVESKNPQYDSRDNCNALIETSTNTLILGCNNTTIPNSVTSIGNNAFSGCRGLTSVTIPKNVTSIGHDAFSGCSGLTSVTCLAEQVPSTDTYLFSGVNTENATLYVPKASVEIYKSQAPWNSFGTIEAFRYYDIDGIRYEIDVETNDVAVIANSSNKYTGDIVIPSSIIVDEKEYAVTRVGDYAFSGCDDLTSLTVPYSVTHIGDYAFSGCDNAKFYANRGTDGLLALWNYGIEPFETGTTQKLPCPDIHIFSTTQTAIQCSVSNKYADLSYEINGEQVYDDEFTLSGLRPDYTQEISLCVHSANNRYRVSVNATTASISPQVNVQAVTASSISIRASYTKGDARVVSTLLMIGGKEFDSEDGTARGLTPNSNYTCYYQVIVEDDGGSTYTYEDSRNVTTAALNLTTLQPKVVNMGNVVVGAESNIDDDETKVGFEWRRTDWTEEFASNTGPGYLYNGMMEGYVRNLYIERLWKYRAYYETESGIRYYSEWVGIDPTNTNYYEPNVHTYSTVNVTTDGVEVKGYAMRGTDDITKQGFMYWENSQASTNARGNRVASVPSNAKVVEVKGNIMKTTLQDLEHDTEYCCVAFITTSENETFYGELQTFRTETDETYIVGDANGNGEVEIGDVTSVLTLMATPEATGYNNKAADANGNGEIEIGDVTTILTIMAGN